MDRYANREINLESESVHVKQLPLNERPENVLISEVVRKDAGHTPIEEAEVVSKIGGPNLITGKIAQSLALTDNTATTDVNKNTNSQTARTSPRYGCGVNCKSTPVTITDGKTVQDRVNFDKRPAVSDPGQRGVIPPHEDGHVYPPVMFDDPNIADLIPDGPVIVDEQIARDHLYIEDGPLLNPETGTLYHPNERTLYRGSNPNQPIDRNNPPIYRQNTPVYRQNPTVYRQNPPVYRENPPVYRPNPPVYGENPPVYGENPPVYRVNPPVYRVNPPIYRENPPIYRENPPIYRENPPIYTENPPIPRVNPPTYRGIVDVPNGVYKEIPGGVYGEIPGPVYREGPLPERVPVTRPIVSDRRLRPPVYEYAKYSPTVVIRSGPVITRLEPLLTTVPVATILDTAPIYVPSTKVLPNDIALSKGTSVSTIAESRIDVVQQPSSYLAAPDIKEPIIVNKW